MAGESTEQLMCVLVVDEDRATRTAARHFLEDAGFYVQLAEDGPAAAELLRSRGAWLALVTGHETPRLDGCALAGRAHHLHPELPVLLMTSRPARLSNGAAAEVDASLPKPVHDPEQLLRALRSACETRATRVRRAEQEHALRRRESQAHGRPTALADATRGAGL